MPHDEFPIALWILLGINSLMLFLLWLGQLSQAARLRRIVRDLEDGMHGHPGSPPPDQPGAGSGPTLFERWLAEDRARREMPKKDQFAAYRRWRAEQGLTWNASSEG